MTKRQATPWNVRVGAQGGAHVIRQCIEKRMRFLAACNAVIAPAGACDAGIVAIQSHSAGGTARAPPAIWTKAMGSGSASSAATTAGMAAMGKERTVAAGDSRSAFNSQSRSADAR